MSVEAAQALAAVPARDETAPRAEGQNGSALSTGEAMSAISRRVVALLKEYNGKGPVKIRSYHWNDLLVLLMSGGYTTLESTLLQEGHSDAVLHQRAALQQVLMPRFSEVIEQEMGRAVLACMHSNHHAPDYTAELFVLAPRGDVRQEPGAQSDANFLGVRN